MRMQHGIAASVILAVSSTVISAKAQEGVYLFGYGAAQQVQNADTTATGPSVTSSGVTGSSTASGEIQFDPSFEFGGGVGYARDMFRVEVSGSYAQAPADRVLINGTGTAAGATAGADDLNADIDLFSAALDGFVDFPQFQGPLTPYVGLGVAWTPIDVSSLSASVGGTTFTATDLESDDLFSFRLHAGAAYELNEHVSLSAGYRYAIGDDMSFSNTAGDTIDVGYGAHTFNVGLRYALGADPLRSRTERAEYEDRQPRRPTAAPASTSAAFNQQRFGQQPFGQQPFGQQPLIASTAPTGGPFAVQVAAVRDPSQAETAWRATYQRFARLLQNSRPVVVPTQFPGQGDWYQVWVTGYDQATAAQICGALQQAGQPCAVAQL